MPVLFLYYFLWFVLPHPPTALACCWFNLLNISSVYFYCQYCNPRAHCETIGCSCSFFLLIYYSMPTKVIFFFVSVRKNHLVTRKRQGRITCSTWAWPFQHWFFSCSQERERGRGFLIPGGGRRRPSSSDAVVFWRLQASPTKPELKLQTSVTRVKSVLIHLSAYSPTSSQTLVTHPQEGTHSTAPNSTEGGNNVSLRTYF